MLDDICEVQVRRSLLCKGKMGTSGLRAPSSYCVITDKDTATHRRGTPKVA